MCRETRRKLIWAYWWGNIRPALPGSSFGLAVLIFLIRYPMLLGMKRPIYDYPDIAGSAIRSADVLVEQISITPCGKGECSDPVTIWIHIDGHLANAPARFPVHAGEQIRVNYRVGQSGGIYITHTMPLSNRP